LSRSLIFAFLCALILHSVVALVNLNAFKRPSSFTIPPKTLTMNIVVPQPIKKPSMDEGPPIVIKKPLVKKNMTSKIKTPKKVKQKVARGKKVQPARPVIKKETLPEKDRTLSDLSVVNSPADKRKEDDFFEEDPFIPDMVDIPLALPNINNTPHKVKKENVSSLLSAIPVTYAHPMYKSNVSPPYPLLARKRGYQGTALLEVLVSKGGKAAFIRLIGSSGHGILDKAAIKGVSAWLFHPAKRGDELIEMWVRIPVRFKLN